MPGGEFKHRFWFFTDTPVTPHIARNCCVIWKDL